MTACPPSAGYRLGKSLRRHKGAVLAASLVLLALVGGVIGTTWGMLRAEAAASAEAEVRRDAEQAARAEKQAKDEAQAREAETKAVLDFVQTKVFAASKPVPEGGLGFDVKLADAVKAALPFVEGSFREQPLIEARLRMTLGQAFDALGDYETAVEQFRAARTLYEKHRGPDHIDTLASMHSLATAYLKVRRYYDAGLKLHEQTLEQRRVRLGPNHRDTLRSMDGLANSYWRAGRTRRP